MPDEPKTAPELANLRAGDLALLETDAKRFLARERPAQDALLAVITKPRDAIVRDWHFALTRARLIAEGVNAGLLDPPGLTLADQPSGLMAVATAVAAKAMLGDLAAAQLIFDRIEGRTGQRRGDEDADAHAQRMEVLQSLEAVVRAMNARGERRPGDGAKDITAPLPGANGHDKPNGRG